MKRRIAVDLDGCCFNYNSSACHLLNSEFGYSLDADDTNSWDWLQKQVDPNHWKWLWSGGVHRGLFRYGHLIKGAADGVQQLSKLGDIVIVTSRPSSANRDTLDWLSFMRFPVSELHILSKGQSKATVKNLDLAIDDKPENCRDYTEASIPVIMFKQNHNKDCKDFIGIDTWVEVVKLAKVILGKE